MYSTYFELKWSANSFTNQYFLLRGALKCFKWSADQFEKPWLRDTVHLFILSPLVCNGFEFQFCTRTCNEKSTVTTRFLFNLWLLKKTFYCLKNIIFVQQNMLQIDRLKTKYLQWSKFWKLSLDYNLRKSKNTKMWKKRKYLI